MHGAMRRGGKDHGGEVLNMVMKTKEMDGNGGKNPKAKVYFVGLCFHRPKCCREEWRDLG